MSSEVSLNLDSATIQWIDHFAPYGVVVTDREFCIQRWNQWMTSHSGRDVDEVLNRKITEVFPDLIERRLVGQFQRALNGEVSVLSTALHGHLLALPPVSKETEFPWMKQTARIAPLISQGEILGVIIVIEDVTQREWQAEILRRQHARDEILSWALAHLIKSDDPRRVSRELFGKVAAHLDFDSYMLFLMSGSNDSLKLSAAGGLTKEAEDSISVVPLSQIPWLDSAREGQAFIRDRGQIESDATFAVGKALGFHAYIVLPLINGSQLLGSLSFATRTRETIAESEADLLGTIAQYLALALNREKTDRELREAQRQLNEHATQLETKVAERTASLKQNIAELQTFSYTVAHDLRAPIRALKGYSDVLLEDFADQMPADAITVVEKLRNASISMDTLTRDLLEFSKISRQDVHLETVPLDEVVTGILTALGPAARSCVTTATSLPIVLGQRILVNQCISNLIENAFKFVRPGQAPEIKIRSEIVAATVQANASDTKLFTRSRYSLEEENKSPDSHKSRVRLWVEDKGIGIPVAARAKIFGIFERGVNANEFEGTGIGLAIVARAMERMGGNCGVESAEGTGSRFWLEFRLPPGTPA